MKWVDLVHLMLYNLTVYNAKKYYDLDTVIIPYANDNWYTLQLPPRVNVGSLVYIVYSCHNFANGYSYLYRNDVYAFRSGTSVLKYAGSRYWQY